MKKKSIATQEAPGRRYNSGFAYIYLPTDVDREEYIQNCFRTKTVTIYDENAQIHHRVPIDKEKINHIEFPERRNQLGSPVKWENIKPSNSLIVTNVFEFTGDFENQEENEMLLSKKEGGYISELSLQGGEGKGFLNFVGEDTGGHLNINVRNQEANGRINIQLAGNWKNQIEGNYETELTNQIKISIFDPDVDDKETIIKYTKGEGLSYVDEFENEFKINEEGIIHNNGEEAMVKGNVLKDDILDALLDLLINARIPTSIGAQFFTNLIEFQNLKPETQKILSEKSFLE